MESSRVIKLGHLQYLSLLLVPDKIDHREWAVQSLSGGGDASHRIRKLPNLCSDELTQHRDFVGTGSGG